MVSIELAIQNSKFKFLDDHYQGYPAASSQQSAYGK